MPCYEPRDGWRYAIVNGVSVREPCKRPCGMCIGCKLEHARQWAMRCYHEAFMHDNNHFVTLTFKCKKTCPYYWDHHTDPEEEYIPGSVCRHSIKKSDLQKYFKRMRKHYGNETFRYYACGEYGSKLSRRHYHVLFFNLDIPDKKLLHQAQYRCFKDRYQKSMADHDLYTSQTIEKIWGHGFVTIGEVTFESAGYVARYCTKKITGKIASQHYGSKMPEFALMSRGQKKGGIGKPFFDKYLTDIYPKDYITVNGIKMQPPRYYDQLLERSKPKVFEEIKAKRKGKAKPKYYKEMQRVKEVKHHVTKQLKRKVEGD